MDRSASPVGGNAEPVVHLAVPAAYVEPIARLIAELDQRQAPAPPDQRPKPSDEPVVVDWPVDELHRFALGQSRTHHTVCAVLDLLAKRPDHFRSVTDIAVELGLDQPKVIGALSGLTRLVKTHHDYPRLGLPLLRKCVRTSGRRVEMLFAVTCEQAGRWNVVRRQLHRAAYR